ncbi:hypothetical protein D3C74_383860 [compost metagenome]
MLRRDQRMTALAQLKVTTVVHPRLGCLHITGQTRLGEDKVKLSEYIDIVGHLFGNIANHSCQPVENNFNFPFLA